MPVTGHGPASRTVTRSTRPSSMKSWVIPSFLARIAGIRSPGEADLDVDAGGQVVEALERVDRLRRRLMDVDEPLVRADLEVLTRVLVLEGRADHAVDVLVRGQGDGPGDSRPGALRRLDDLAGSAIDGVVVVRLETDSDLVCGNRCQFLALCLCVLIAQMGRRPVLLGHRPWVLCPSSPGLAPGSIRAGLAAGPRGRYSRISVT